MIGDEAEGVPLEVFVTPEDLRGAAGTALPSALLLGAVSLVAATLLARL